MLDLISKPGETEIARLRKGELPDDNMWWSWWGEFRNFGDWLGPYIYNKRTGRRPRYCAPGHVPEGVTVHFTCGSIMQKIRKKNRAMVWGTGIKDPDQWFARPKSIAAVRGPLTRRVLEQRKFDAPEVLGDPGLCMPELYQPSSTEKKFRAGIIPHVYDMPFWQQNLTLLPPEAVLIDLRHPVEAVIDQIACCEATLSSSLHGIIESHAYGVPSCWMASFSSEVSQDFKFRDYFGSVGMDLTSRDRRKIGLPFDLGDYEDDVALPPADLAEMSRRLLGVCPF
ncbi:polysaccharide pyruvyl transferase family protein [Paracoccus sp. Z118]|uniref:polysaccharide pyruvyl transferase family protein n=1 Tax=Paracoccus sp. Z118 TaxID=2851017 RepID=UPI001C2CBE61|nr:polysaccharide pyruvyl transferase family protein [Paracoccus sp. Z118]MBV0892424.1 polysaccharide pyruvyl transferase family protein [Paracoccus sp. Z118]